jgi:hypothetical protein
MSQPETFEQFWPHFLSSHRQPLTRWLHVAALGVGALGVLTALRQRRLGPALLGTTAGAALALFAHPLVEGNRAENGGQPLWAARALLRMCGRTISGSIAADLAELERDSAAS